MPAATIVSLFPQKIKEKKPVWPNQFEIEAAPRNGFSIFVTAEEYTRRIYIDHERGTLIMPEKTEVIAKSVCNDFIDSMIGVKEGCRPGLFYVMGSFTKDQIQQNHQKELAEARIIQTNWFTHLVMLADDDWKKHGQHKVITSLQRLACDQLGLNRPWNLNLGEEVMVKCRFCTTLVSSEAVVCPQCNNILNVPKYNAMKAPLTAPTVGNQKPA